MSAERQDRNTLSRGRPLPRTSTPWLVALLGKRPDLADTATVAARIDEAVRWSA